MTTLARTVTQPPRLPLAAACTTLARRPSVWWVLIAWLLQSVGFGVGLNYGYYVQFSNSTAPYAADAAAQIREAMQLSNLAGFAAGSIPFYGTACAVVLGALVIGYDYTHRTAGLLMTQGPSRSGVMAAQTIALTCLTGLTTVATYLTTAVALAVVGQLSGWTISAPDWPTVLGSLLASWLSLTAYALLGATLAVVFRSAVAALGIGLVWTLGIETGIVALSRAYPALGPVATHTLAGATSNLAVARGAFPWWFNAPQDTATATDGWIAAATLIVWILGCLTTSWWMITRRDI